MDINQKTVFQGFKPRLIYVFRINDLSHGGCLKIGETTLDDDSVDALSIKPNASELNDAAKKRIDQYTRTAGIGYDLLHTEAAIYKTDKGIFSFSDKKVHAVLLRSGIHRRKFNDTNKRGIEWFVTDLETAKKAIKAVKEGRKSLMASEISEGMSPIIFRPEQQDAIDRTEKRFKKGNKMLWNAKMRFGKTLSALQVVRDMEFGRTLILTHRPVVNKGWFEDFGKIFYDRPDYLYGSKASGESFENLERRYRNNGVKYVYFASIQDLRGSEKVGGNFDKNNEVFSTIWDLIIVDEAHEGTQTELGKAVMDELEKPETKVLRLSGTPFNLLSDFDEEDIYTWDYVMEQKAKTEWDINHYGDPNPYAGLPKLNIFTYDMGKLLSEYSDEDKAFNFREFFKVNENDQFVHKDDIESFLNLLTKEDEDSMYPFSNEHYRDIFRHTLWILPGVREAKSLSAMLREHDVFQNFKVVNVAGDGDEDEENKNALQMVEDAIGSNPDETRTITLSCGRLTTGVTVKAWTGVFMLAGSYSTAASAYMQTIFRVQSPATINGRVKEDCYVFDFAPDRTLQVLATVPRVSTKAGKTTDHQRRALGEFLNFCPVISIAGSKMTQMDETRMLEHLKRAYVEKVVRSGFEDGHLYNDELLKLDDIDLAAFADLKKIIGQTKAMAATASIDINSQGLTDEQYEEKEMLEGIRKKDRTPEEQARLDELKEKAKMRSNAISILRGISIRMPLLIYGAEIKREDETKELTIDNFSSLVDDQSWEEFMPRDVTKELFSTFTKYYDEEIFSASAKRIREMARAADKMTIEERMGRIATIFSTFRNPDKETVLTPWRVVNMHLGDTLGGYCFFDEGYKEMREEPRFIDQRKVTEDVFAPDTHLLEINSKSGLYPLYLAYNVYRRRLKDCNPQLKTLEEHLELWDKVVRENIFVICKTPMAKSITKRTLVGFRDAKVNTRHFEDLINQIKNKPDNFLKKVVQGNNYWKANNDDNMKFNAVVGNPPYQVMDGGGTGSSAIPIYNKFVDVARLIKPSYISMIMPSRWMTGGKGLDNFRESMLKDRHIQIIHDFLNSNECFPNVSIEGGVCYFRWDRENVGKCTFISHSYNTTTISTRFLASDSSGVLIRDADALSILDRIPYSKRTFASYVSTRNLFKIDDLALNDQYKNGNDIKVFGRYGGVRGLKYISRYYTNDPRAKNFLGNWKVFISKADGAAGQLGNPIPARIIGKAELGDPNTICTETFLAIGPFTTRLEAQNVINYLETKFLRFLVGVRKLKNMTQDTYSFVPLQDFTANSDIDWSKSVAEIDQQLYDKYGLTTEERQFIEQMIRPM